MFVVVEGCDGTGKTTLVRELAEQLDGKVDIFHRGPPTRHPLQEYETDVECYTPGTGRNIICDRWGWGEQIYGPLYRAGSRLGSAGWIHVELFLRRRGTITLFLDNDEEVIAERLEARGEDFLQKHDLRLVMNGYRSLATQTLSYMACLTGETTGSDVIGAVLQASLLESTAAAVTDNGSLVGSPQPRYLLLGERRGSLNLGRHLAAFVPYPSTSGRFLLDSLPLWLLPDLAIANALEENLPLLWKQLGKPRVVALGHKASDACTEADIIHYRMSHPQHARRFHHGLQRDYGETIARSLVQWEDCSSWPN